MDHKAFQEMRLAGDLCDLTIQIRDREMHVHRVLIAARSHYFRGLLHSGMQDSSHVVLDGLPGGYSSLELIVDFCYGIIIRDRIDESNIARILCSASYLQMSGPRNLEDICRSKLERLTGSSLLSCLNILNNCSGIDLSAEGEGVARRCIEAAGRHFRSVHHSDSLDKICELMKDLPISWFVEIMDTLQAEKIRTPLIISLSAFYITTVVQRFIDSCERQSDVSCSNSNLLCRPSVAHPNLLLGAFEAVLAYMPNDAPRLALTTVKSNPTWFARALEFATTNLLTSASRLFAMCASVYDKLASANYDAENPYYNFKPSVLIELNKIAQTNNATAGATVAKMTDSYLLGQAHRSLTASQFALVLRSTAWCPRLNFDGPVNALEEMLKGSHVSVSDEELAEMAAEVDFTKLTQDALERAAENERIPDKIVKTAAVKTCSQLRYELREKNKEIFEKTITHFTTTAKLAKEEKKVEELSESLARGKQQSAMLERSLDQLHRKTESITSKAKRDKERSEDEIRLLRRTKAKLEHRVAALEAGNRTCTFDLEQAKNELEGGWIEKIRGSWKASQYYTVDQHTPTIMDIGVTDVDKATFNMDIKRYVVSSHEWDRSYRSFPFDSPQRPSKYVWLDSARTLVAKDQIYYLKGLPDVTYGNRGRDFPFVLFNKSRDELMTLCHKTPGHKQLELKEFACWKRSPDPDSAPQKLEELF